jgi:hypothetical protein
VHVDHLPALLDDEDPVRVTRRRGDVERRVEAPDLLQAGAAGGGDGLGLGVGAAGR